MITQFAHPSLTHNSLSELSFVTFKTDLMYICMQLFNILIIILYIVKSYEECVQKLSRPKLHSPSQKGTANETLIFLEFNRFISMTFSFVKSLPKRFF